MVKKIEKNRYLICLILLVVLCWLFPYTGDDWAWGSSIGIERLNNWFDNYSGRYVGNLIVLALTRSNALKSFVMAFMIMSIIYSIERLIKERWAFYLSCVLLILLPKAIFRQSIVWTSGFANYVTSIFFTLIYIVYIYKIFENQKPKQKLLHCIPLFILGAVNTLIVEHMTIYNLVMAFSVIVFTFIKYRTIVIQYVAYFTGTLAGTVYMFSNSVYHSISENVDGYRSVSTGGPVAQAVQNYLNVIYEELYMNNIWLNIVLLVICILLYLSLKHSETGSGVKKYNSLLKLCLWIMAAYDVYAFFSVVGLDTAAKQKSLMYLEGMATIVSAVAVIVFAVTISIIKNNLWKILFIIGSILCIAAPLLEVNPIGSRCFFATYVLFILFVCEMGKMLPVQYRDNKILGQIRRICMMIEIAGMIYYMCIFTAVYKADHNRLDYIKDKIEEGQKRVEILHLPYESYIWTPTPAGGDVWEERYKLFYDLPSEIQLVPVWQYSK